MAVEHEGSVWNRRAPSGRRTRLSRRQIVRKAVRLAKGGGLDAVTMRGVAAALEVSPMALYPHVGDRDGLVALMEDEVLGECLVPAVALEKGWRDAVTAIARRTCDALRAHPWVLLVPPRPWIGPNGMRHAEQLLEALADTTLDAAGRIDAIHLVDDHVRGYVSRLPDLGAPERLFGEERAAYLRFADREVTTGGLTHLRAAVDGLPGRLDASWQRVIADGDPENARFERGLGILLDGLETAMGRRSAKGRRRVSRPR